MSILTINFKELAKNAEIKHNNKKTKWKPQLPATFLDHTLPLFASVKLETTGGIVSATDTFNGLKSTPVITTPNGDVPGTDIVELLKFIYFGKRGDLLPGSQIRNPRYAALTPLFLYAHKLYNDVPYGSWDRTDPLMKVFLGTHLESILEVDEVPNLTIDQVVDARKEALTFKSGVKMGQQDQPFNYKCGINGLNGVELPKLVIIMTLQLWLAHSSVRNTESMILDPLDWNNVPEALDLSVPIPELKAKKSTGDIQWN